MTDNSTIPTDVDDTDGFDAFLSSFNDDPKKRADADPSENDEGAPDTQAETAEQTEDTTSEPEEGSENTDPDDQEFEVRVGEETKKATLRELKRLYGQEAALTQKSQKVSEALREAETQTIRANESAKKLLENAQERYKPYAGLDWLVLSQQMETETLVQLRQDAAIAKRDVDFLTQEVDGHMKEQQTRQSQAYQTAAQDCIKVLSDPKTGIEGFGKPIYDEMMAFAAEAGVPDAPRVTSPGALKVLHMAMLYAKAQKAAKDAEGKAKRAVDTQKRVLKPGAQAQGKDGKRAAMQALRNSGDLDDAAAAFQASF